MVDAFQEHLERVCGLARNTLIYRIRYAREFLNYRFRDGEFESGEIMAADLMGFVYLKAETCSPRSLGAIASSLRSFLRFLQFKGLCDGNLVSAVPTVSCRMDSNVPNRLSDEQLERFLSSFDRDHSTGQRDYASHRCIDTTKIYTKVNLTTLSTVPLPWPEVQS